LDDLRFTIRARLKYPHGEVSIEYNYPFIIHIPQDANYPFPIGTLRKFSTGELTVVGTHGDLFITTSNNNIHTLKLNSITQVTQLSLEITIKEGPEGGPFTNERNFTFDVNRAPTNISLSLNSSHAFIPNDTEPNPILINQSSNIRGTNLGSWVGHGIDIVREKLKVSPIDKKPKLMVFKNCKNLIREFETYRWKEEKDDTLNKPGRPEKANDHALDALRYFAVSYTGRKIEFPEPDHKDWSFT